MAMVIEFERPFESAVERVFDRTTHTQADIDAVRDAWDEADVGHIARREMDATVAAWLDAASRLRERDVPATPATIVAMVANGWGYPARMAGDLIERAMGAEYEGEIE